MICWGRLTTLFLLLEFEKGRLRLLNLAQHQERLQLCALCLRLAVLSYSTGNLLASLRDTQVSLRPADPQRWLTQDLDFSQLETLQQSRPNRTDAAFSAPFDSAC
ncbi:hypothetical protein B0T18DRAFT_183257 [Schizothecium vesticola]|uniref:Uncharacterized protein n=1 Tax=Schizothecium vesticola TaxID=314040 RepID=A0AA40EQ01_9PEZI|nr:hypothetical protein B0T18DRAFT_183257 [Schizothecium vesticola]